MDALPVPRQESVPTLRLVNDEPMTKAEAEACEHRMNLHWAKSCEHKAYARRELYELYRRKGYVHLGDGYETIEAYTLATKGWKRRYTYHLIEATEAERGMCAVAPEIEEDNLRESWLRELFKIKDDRARVEVYQEAKATAVNGKVKASFLKEIGQQKRLIPPDEPTQMPPHAGKVHNCAQEGGTYPTPPAKLPWLLITPAKECYDAVNDRFAFHGRTASGEPTLTFHSAEHLRALLVKAGRLPLEEAESDAPEPTSEEVEESIDTILPSAATPNQFRDTSKDVEMWRTIGGGGLFQ